MKYIVGIIAVALTLTLTPLQALGANGNECQGPEGCDWRTVVQIQIIDKDGVEGWSNTWSGPRTSFIGNVQHAYLLLEHIFSRDPGAIEPKLMDIIRQIGAQTP